MTRHLMIAAIVVQIGVMFATVAEWPHLFLPALAGVLLLWIALPTAANR